MFYYLAATGFSLLPLYLVIFYRRYLFFAIIGSTVMLMYMIFSLITRIGLMKNVSKMKQPHLIYNSFYVNITISIYLSLGSILVFIFVGPMFGDGISLDNLPFIYLMSMIFNIVDLFMQLLVIGIVSCVKNEPGSRRKVGLSFLSLSIPIIGCIIAGVLQVLCLFGVIYNFREHNLQVQEGEKDNQEIEV